MADRCSACTSEIEDGAVVCAQCGAATSVPGPLPDPPPGPTDPGLLSAATAPASIDAVPLPFSSTLLDSDRHLEGLFGWLILVGIGVVISPFVILSTTVSTNLPLFTSTANQAFLSTHPAVEGLIVFEIATNLIFVALLAFLNFLFFKKKRSFPTYMILYLILHTLIVVGDTAAAHALLPAVDISGSFTGVLRSLVGATIWIPYLLVSRRVKVTFVN
jgi:hypothetical protein